MASSELPRLLCAISSHSKLRTNSRKSARVDDRNFEGNFLRDRHGQS